MPNLSARMGEMKFPTATKNNPRAKITAICEGPASQKTRKKMEKKLTKSPAP